MIFISNILLALSWFLITMGLIGISKFDSLYSKLLTSSKIDTAAVILILIGLILRVNMLDVRIKIFIILCFVLLTSPISNHLISFSAYFNGVEVEEIDYND